MTRSVFGFAICGLLLSSPTMAQQSCEVFVKDAFNTSLRKSGASSSSSFKSWQCTTEFSSHDQAISAGLDVGAVIYGVPVSLGGTFDKSQVDNWKKNNCSEEQRSANQKSASYEFVRTFSPEAATLAAKCLDATMGPRALSCEISGTGKTPVFSAQWRRTDGDAVPPKVKKFTVSGGECKPTFVTDETISEGGRPAICEIADEKDLIVALETDRGSCFQTVSKSFQSEIIAGNVVLTGNKIVQSEVVEIRPDARIVTNGYQFSIAATRELKIGGNPTILSFDPASPAPGQAINGRPAGAIVVQAPKATGGQLTIQNFGEDGMKGPTGPRGGEGLAAKGGVWKELRGCVGRRDGGNGGPGLVGGQGGNGGPGGPVVLNIKSGLQDGALSRILVVTQQQMADGTTRICTGSCGGKGGSGGDGGPGGFGARKANGHGQCGDGKAGRDGGGGPVGPAGSPGLDVPVTTTTL
jgi:hypothetical protein